MKDLCELLNLPQHLDLKSIHREEDKLTLSFQSHCQSAACSVCGTVSHRIHGYYQRSLQDLPCSAWRMKLQLRLVRFCCDNTACPRQTFVETIPSLAMRYSRRTNRATELLTHIAFELGGQAGQRVAEKCHLRISGTTMLRLVRRSQLPELTPVEVLGIDDWAFCRGTRYGTILVDLERKKVVELLPEVNADMVSAWLQAQPTIRIISRDRSYVFAKAAQKGAPLAQQVVDRWHLMHNLWDVLVLIFGQHLKDLKQVNLPPPAASVYSTKHRCPAIAAQKTPSITH